MDEIEFLKNIKLYDNEAYSYIKDNISYITRYAPGVFINTEKGILNSFHVNVPYKKTFEEELQNIHELTHAFQTYPYLGKKAKYVLNKKAEILPIAAERLYTIVNNVDKIEWLNNYQIELLKDSSYRHLLGYYYQFDVIDNFLNKGEFIDSNLELQNITEEVVKKKILSMKKYLGN